MIFFSPSQNIFGKNLSSWMIELGTLRCKVTIFKKIYLGTLFRFCVNFKIMPKTAILIQIQMSKHKMLININLMCLNDWNMLIFIYVWFWNDIFYLPHVLIWPWTAHFHHFHQYNWSLIYIFIPWKLFEYILFHEWFNVESKGAIFNTFHCSYTTFFFKPCVNFT